MRCRLGPATTVGLAGLAAVALGAAAFGCRKAPGQGAEAAATDTLVVTSPADLKGAGSLTVAEARRAAIGIEVVLAADNTSARPLRITRLDVSAVDSKGVVRRPVGTPPELTVPAKTKDRLVVAFQPGDAELIKVRIWGVDHDLPALVH